MATRRRWGPSELARLRFLRRLGWGYGRIGHALSRPPSTIRQKVIATGFRDAKWTEAEFVELRRLRETDMPWEEIGRRLSRGATACANKWRNETTRKQPPRGAVTYTPRDVDYSKSKLLPLDFGPENVTVRRTGPLRVGRPATVTALGASTAALCEAVGDG